MQMISCRQQYPLPQTASECTEKQQMRDLMYLCRMVLKSFNHLSPPSLYTPLMAKRFLLIELQRFQGPVRPLTPRLPNPPPRTLKQPNPGPKLPPPAHFIGWNIT